MCGIFALINRPGLKVDVPACRAATALLRYRGPDAEGELLTNNGEVYLGHRRLSIIDLSPNASQPMVRESGACLVYNGEIYNYAAIRDRLTALGAPFRSTGDTETLLRAFDRWGIACLTELEGMFAFVHWNPQAQEAFIVRDFFGIKPLYFCTLPSGALAVSSEIKSFYAIKGFRAELNEDALPEYLGFRGLCGDQTLLKGVRQVRPGEYLHFERQTGELTSRAYWDPLDELGAAPAVTPEEFLERFTRTTAAHLISDAPVGAQFSGGLDSALVSALAVKDLGAKLTGFHCHVENAAFDETPLAKETARALGMPLVTVDLDANVFFSDILEKLTTSMDEPLTHPNSVGIYLLSERAKSEVKVLLSGEAADELFCGYARHSVVYGLEKLRQWGFGALEPWLTQGLLDKRLPPSLSPGDVNVDSYILAGSAPVSRGALTALLQDADAWERSVAVRRGMLESLGHLSPLDRCRIYDVKTYLPPLFIRQDKMSMAASIENRVPFATPNTLALAFGPPHDQLISLTRRKRFLKECLMKRLPRRYVLRRKWGFGLPLDRWFKSAVGQDRLESIKTTDFGFMATTALQGLRAENLTMSQANLVWTTLALKVWMGVFLKTSPPFMEGIIAHQEGVTRLESR